MLVVLYTNHVCHPAIPRQGTTDLIHTPMFRQKLCHLTQVPKKNNKDLVKHELKI